MVDVEEGYACPECESFHEDQDDALSCCTYAEPSYKCGECGEEYSDESDAEECCEDEDKSFNVSYPNIIKALKLHSDYEGEVSIKDGDVFVKLGISTTGTMVDLLKKNNIKDNNDDC